MKKLVILGAGGHCLSVLDSIIPFNDYENIVILDPNVMPGTYINGKYKVIGTDNELEHLCHQGYTHAFIAFAAIESIEIRKKLWKKVRNAGYLLPNIIDPTATVSANAKLGEGIFIGKKAVVNAGAVINDMSIINTGAVIEHGCSIGEFSHVAVNGILCGNVSLGACCLIGANSTVIQNISIGNRCIIGAGSVVLRNVKDEETVYGIISK